MTAPARFGCGCPDSLACEDCQAMAGGPWGPREWVTPPPTISPAEGAAVQQAITAALVANRLTPAAFRSLYAGACAAIRWQDADGLERVRRNLARELARTG